MPESPLRKVIFLQKIFRFAGRTPKDLVIINFVCKDFEETMQAHHTFNLVLYDNIIKKRKDEDDFLWRSITFITTAPAWIIYQWTTVNEHDEAQRELLKTFLIFQAENGNEILIRKDDFCLRRRPILMSHVSGEDPSTTRELFRHILDSCFKLGIVKEVLGASRYGLNCIMQAVLRNVSVDSFKVLIDTCVRHGLDVKKMLEHQESSLRRNCIMLASVSQCSVDSFQFLVECCIPHGVDMTKMLEQLDDFKFTCLSLAVQHGLDADSFRLLIALFPSNESFRATLAMENSLQKRAVDYAKKEEVKTLLKDPDCWKKCRDWCASNGITFQRVEQESGTRRERE